MKKKKEAFKRYLETKEGKDYTIYVRARNQARWICRKAKNEFQKKLAHESKANPKAFYKYANSKLKMRSGVADLDTAEGNIKRYDR